MTYIHRHTIQAQPRGLKNEKIVRLYILRILLHVYYILDGYNKLKFSAFLSYAEVNKFVKFQTSRFETRYFPDKPIANWLKPVCKYIAHLVNRASKEAVTK